MFFKLTKIKIKKLYFLLIKNNVSFIKNKNIYPYVILVDKNNAYYYYSFALDYEQLYIIYINFKWILKMKKTLFSLLILSSISLSNQAIAGNYQFINSQPIDIIGEVINNTPTCTLGDIAPIILDNVNSDDIGTTDTAKEIKIKFSDCYKSGKKISLSLAQGENPYLTNLVKEGDASNVSIQIFDKNDLALSLDSEISLDEKIVDGNAEFVLKANYMKPAGGEEVKAGKIKSNLTFDAYINDDMIDEDASVDID